MLDLQFSNEKWTFLLPIILMGLDIVSGFLLAAKKKEINSTKIREGLFKKAGEILVLVFIFVLSEATNLPRLVLIASSIIVCDAECISFIENVSLLGFKKTDVLKKLLKGEKDEA